MPILVEIDTEQGIAEVRLARPEKSNALDFQMFSELVDAGARLAKVPGIRAVILSGEGKAFCSGIDLDCLEGLMGPSRESLAPRSHGAANLYQQAVWTWRELPVPVIAAVHGVAYGGGLQLALGADLRYAAPDTRFSVMEARWGLIPDMAGTQLMRHLARDDVIKELTYTGRVFSAREALAYGLVTRLCDDPRAAGITTAREIAARSPDAVREAKRLLSDVSIPKLTAGLLAESQAQARLLGSPNQREATAANLQRREPRFQD